MGHFSSALRRARQSYAQRRHNLLTALQPCLGTQAQISGAEQGLHLSLRLSLRLPDTLNDQALVQQIRNSGLVVRPLSAYCLQRRDIRGPVIGCA